jgi:uncharacterized membrane protein YdjX (TVP38/TMEM64 family)
MPDERRSGPSPGLPPPAATGRRAALVRLAVLGLVLGGALLALTTSGVELSAEGIRRRVEGIGPLAPILYVPLSVVLSSIGVPAPALAGAAGLLFGIPLGALVAHTGIVLAACTQMLISRTVARDRAAALLPARARGLDHFLERRGFWAVLYLRIVPGLPFIAVNYAAGLTSLRVRDMALGTLIGKAPRTWAYAALGGSLGDLGSPQARLAAGLLVIMAVGGAVLLRREYRAERGGRSRAAPRP